MRRQKGYFKIVTNTQSITSDTFTSSRVFVLAGPREKFTENEFDHLRRYLETGGSLLVLLGEGGEKRHFFTGGGEKEKTEYKYRPAEPALSLYGLIKPYKAS